MVLAGFVAASFRNLTLRSPHRAWKEGSCVLPAVMQDTSQMFLCDRLSVER